MQLDIYDNRQSVKVIKGDILQMQILTEGGYEHICLTLNTGFNVLLEMGAWDEVKRYIEAEVHEE